MTDCVYYHHPEDEQYSLAYVTLDNDDVSNHDNNIISMKMYMCSIRTPGQAERLMIWLMV
jgi:hypothetical protein